MDENQVASQLVDAAYQVHSALGPGLMETVYETVYAYELQKRGMKVNRQVPIPVIYDNIRLDEAFRADLMVNDLVIVELKSVETVLPVHKKQLLTYLRLTGKKLGLLINFNSSLIKHGICRVVNGLPDGPINLAK